MDRDHKRESLEVVNELAKRKVQDMHYEARVNCVRNWFGDRKIWMNKSQARDMLFEPWQYLQVVGFLFYEFLDFILFSIVLIHVSCGCSALLSLWVMTNGASRRW